MEDALLLADVARVVVLDQVIVEVGPVVEARLAKLAPRVARLSELGIALIDHVRKTRTHRDTHPSSINQTRYRSINQTNLSVLFMRRNGTGGFFKTPASTPLYREQSIIGDGM